MKREGWSDPEMGRALKEPAVEEKGIGMRHGGGLSYHLSLAFPFPGLGLRGTLAHFESPNPSTQFGTDEQ